jgi:hypothetical protein
MLPHTTHNHACTHVTATHKIIGNFHRFSTAICTSLLLEVRRSDSHLFYQSQWQQISVQTNTHMYTYQHMHTHSTKNNNNTRKGRKHTSSGACRGRRGSRGSAAPRHHGVYTRKLSLCCGSIRILRSCSSLGTQLQQPSFSSMCV